MKFHLCMLTVHNHHEIKFNDELNETVGRVEHSIRRTAPRVKSQETLQDERIIAVREEASLHVEHQCATGMRDSGTVFLE